MTTWTDDENGGTVWSDSETGGRAVTEFARTLLDDATASEAQSTLGLSDFAKTLVDDASAAAARSTLGVPGLTDLAASTGSSLVGFDQSGTGAVSESVEEAIRNGFVSVMSFIPVAERPAIRARTSTTDLSTYIQAAIDAINAAGGGLLFFPPGHYKANVVLKTGVYLWGGEQGYLASGDAKIATIVAYATGAAVDTPVTAVNNCGVIGVNVVGLGAGTAAKGIRFRAVSRGFIRAVSANNFADEAILLESGCGACVVEDIITTNVVLNRARSAVIGAVDIHGNDHFLNRIEANISGSTEGTVQSVNLYCVALAVRGSNGFISDCIGEISDVGIYVSGSKNRFTGCRGDLNYGHGWSIVGGDNRFAACDGISNSQDTTNTYDNWNASSASGNNLFVGCGAASSAVKLPRYGFNDAASSATNKNRYVDCFSDANIGTGRWNLASSAASAVLFPSGPNIRLTNNSTTPSVAQACNFDCSNSSATTITNFTDGVPGQEISIFVIDSNTTIQHNGSTIALFNAGNKKLRSGVTYKFRKDSGSLWREVESFGTGVNADVGDAAKSLQARIDEETQIWNTPLTADRAVTLSTTGDYAGSKFRIVRTAAATGAFNLNVGSGPLKALAAGQWCDVESNGTAWVLTAYGAL